MASPEEENPSGRRAADIKDVESSELESRIEDLLKESKFSPLGPEADGYIWAGAKLVAANIAYLPNPKDHEAAAEQPSLVSSHDTPVFGARRARDISWRTPVDDGRTVDSESLTLVEKAFVVEAGGDYTKLPGREVYECTYVVTQDVGPQEVVRPEVFSWSEEEPLDEFHRARLARILNKYRGVLPESDD